MTGPVYEKWCNVYNQSGVRGKAAFWFNAGQAGLGSLWFISLVDIPARFSKIQISLFSFYNILLSPLSSCTLHSLCGRRPHRLGEIETSQCLESDFSIPTAEYGNLMSTCRSQSVFTPQKFDGLELCKSMKLLSKLHAGYILMDLSLSNQAYTFPSLGFGSCYIDPRILISISRLVFPS